MCRSTAESVCGNVVDVRVETMVVSHVAINYPSPAPSAVSSDIARYGSSRSDQDGAAVVVALP